jgi:hypothetical protein
MQGEVTMKRLSAALLLLLLLSVPAQAATTHVQNYAATPSGSATYTITGVNMSPGDAATACVIQRANMVGSITNVTFAGSSAGWGNIGSTGDQGGTWQACWGATGLSGTGDVVITPDDTPIFAHAFVDVWDGVDAVDPFGATAQAFDSGGGSLTIQDVVCDANGVAFGVAYIRGNEAGAANSGGTQTYDVNEGTFGSTGLGQYVSPGSAATDIAWTGTGGNTVGGLGFCIHGATGGGGTINTHPALMLGGVGNQDGGR